MDALSPDDALDESENEQADDNRDKVTVVQERDNGIHVHESLDVVTAEREREN